MNKIIITAAVATLAFATFAQEGGKMRENPEAKLHRFSTTVEQYAKTKGACGGVDFWGNCWEWTSTMRGEGLSGVKGGAFDSKRTECRTEARTESRKSSVGYPNVTFRVVREDK